MATVPRPLAPNFDRKIDAGWLSVLKTLRHRTGLFAQSTAGRFLVVGALSYLVNQAVLYALYGHVSLGGVIQTPIGGIDTGLLLASVIALEVSIVVRFALNDLWTFRSRRQKSFLLRLYQSNVTSLASPALSLAVVNFLTPVFGVNYLLSNSIGILLGLSWNWAWSSRLVWPDEAARQIDPLKGANRG